MEESMDEEVGLLNETRLSSPTMAMAGNRASCKSRGLLTIFIVIAFITSAVTIILLWWSLLLTNRNQEVARLHTHRTCNIYKGKWVKDEEYPLYKPDSCPFVASKFNCHQNGRLDSEYTKWRWQPDDCDLPRFDGKRFLEKIRGKRLALVGDSLNRNQWESMVCMLYQALPDKSRVFVEVAPNQSERRAVFQDYNSTVEFYKSRYLVNVEELSSENDFILDLDVMDKRADTKWKTADVLVFNTGNWWTTYKLGNGEYRFRQGGVTLPNLDITTAYNIALSTWAHWIHQSVDPKATTVFIRTLSPDHFKGGAWNAGGYCHDETQPILDENFSIPTPKMTTILTTILEKLRFPVHTLAISHLSGYRKDAHPATYWNPQKTQYQDCRHWCLPGLPDTWNELLYFEYARLMGD